MTGTRPPAPSTSPAVGPATCDAAADLARAALDLLMDRLGDTPTGPTAGERVEVARILRSAAHLLDPPTPRPQPQAQPRPQPEPRPGWVHVDDVAAIAAILRTPGPAASPPPAPAPAAAAAGGSPTEVARPLRPVDPDRPTPHDLAAHRRPR